MAGKRKDTEVTATAGKKQKQGVSVSALLDTDVSELIASAGDDKQSLCRLRD